MGHQQLAQGGLERAEALPRELRQDVSQWATGKRRIETNEVGRLRPARQSGDLAGKGLGIGLRLADLLHDGVGVVGQVDAAHVGRVRLAHLGRAVAQAHDPGRLGRDDRIGQGEDGRVFRSEVVVELLGDVAGQLQVLLLVLAHRHVGRLVEQDVGGLEHGVGEQRDRGALAVLAGLVLELRHAVQPAHPGRAVQQPLQLGMGGNLGLVEQDRASRIDPAGDQGGDHLARVGGEVRGHVGHGDRVEVGQEEQAFVAGGGRLVLHAHPVADRAQVVAEVQVAGRLDAGDDAHVLDPCYFLRVSCALSSPSE